MNRRILVVTEGEVTEPAYLEGFKRWCRNPLVEVRVEGDLGTNPKTLVEQAKGLKNDALRSAKKQRDENLSYDEVWCAFDIDKHERLPDAVQMARDNGILLAVSNPCIELWLLLHFRDSPGSQHHRAFPRLMREYIKDYNKHVRFADYQPHYEGALRRAQQLDRQAEGMEEAGRNPTTGFWRLTESIRRKE